MAEAIKVSVLAQDVIEEHLPQALDLILECISTGYDWYLVVNHDNRSPWLMTSDMFHHYFTFEDEEDETELVKIREVTHTLV